MSIERSPQFHQIRRILKTVAPDYRILANPGLKPGFSALDLRKKTIEIAEESSNKDSIPALIFQIGHAIYHKHYGVEISDSPENLARKNVEIDAFASGWTVDVLFSFFNFKLDDARNTVNGLVWSYEDWLSYFSD